MSDNVETTPAVVPAEEPKVEAPVVETTKVAENVPLPDPASEPAADAVAASDATPAEAKPTEEAPVAAEESKEPAPKKSPNFISKILAPFKDLKVKSPKSPKKHKEAEVVAAPAPAVEEAPVVEAPAPVAVVEEAPKEPAPEAPVPAAETVEAAPAAEEPAKAEEKKTPAHVKISRRLSSRVTGFFSPKKNKEEASVPAKVDEAAPQIEEQTPVAPLDAAPAEPKADETHAKPEDVTPVVVSAAA